MSDIKIQPMRRLNGEITPPPDKSISHRSIMLGALADGTTKARNVLLGEDVKATIGAFENLGVKIDMLPDNAVVVHGAGLHGLKKSAAALYLANSGTTMRLLMGILAGQPFESVLTGDESLSKRPMKRVAKPLRMMGASISGPDDANRAPLTVKGGSLKPIDYKTEVASAQVKSSIILAGLYANGTTSVREPSKSRDHTERMLKIFGVNVDIDDLKVSIKGPSTLKARDIDVPGDISSASFFIVAAAILNGSSFTIKSVGLNPTRTGILEILNAMSAKISVLDKRDVAGEPVGDLRVNSSDLKGVVIEGDIIARAIDELPILMVAACFAHGTTIIKQAGELRVKETDRISSMVENLKNMGADIEAVNDDVIIKGNRPLKGVFVNSHKDHRTAMSLAIAALAAKGDTVIDDAECVAISFPGFFNMLNGLK